MQKKIVCAETVVEAVMGRAADNPGMSSIIPSMVPLRPLSTGHDIHHDLSRRSDSNGDGIYPIRDVNTHAGSKRASYSDRIGVAGMQDGIGVGSRC
jgi:hypothetical protein